MQFSSIIVEVILLILLIAVYIWGRRANSKAKEGVSHRRKGNNRPRKEAPRRNSQQSDDSLSAFRAEEQRELRENERNESAKPHRQKSQKRRNNNKTFTTNSPAEPTQPTQEIQPAQEAITPKRKPRRRKPQPKTVVAEQSETEAQSTAQPTEQTDTSKSAPKRKSRRRKAQPKGDNATTQGEKRVKRRKSASTSNTQEQPLKD